MCKRQIEAFLPFLEHRASQNTISIPKNQSLQSLSSSVSGIGLDNSPQFNHIDPWTVLEDWDDCPLVPSLFGAISVQRRALTYASAFFRSAAEEEDSLSSAKSPARGVNHHPLPVKGSEEEEKGIGGDMEVENETEATEMDVDIDNPLEGRQLNFPDEEEETPNFMAAEEEEEGEIGLVGLMPASAGGIVLQKVTGRK